MLGSSRPVSEVLQDILANVQVIFRAEIQLAKAELKTEALRARRLALELLIGGVFLFFSVMFLLVAGMYALSLVVPNWAAAVIMGVVTLAAAAAVIVVALKSVKGAKVAPKTVKSVKENFEWNKAPNR